ncbi:MAG: phosphatidylserine decarboxylase [Chlamydiia bacterium]|nr:phosphatidylserine decarboxylase [Chlamydiia bacterium]
MKPHYVIDRETGKKIEEITFGEKAIRFLYGKGKTGAFIAFLAARLPLVSAFYGWLKKRPASKKQVLPFIEKFKVDTKPFIKKPEAFTSFNDFFIRKLKSEERPLASSSAICPVDGRYLFYPDISQAQGFWIKGEKFCLKEFLQDEKLAEAFEKGTLILARLAPPDYHRFHFPVDGIPKKSRLINGYLYSVNPLALKKDIHILSQNKRRLTEIESPLFEKVLMIEVGATNVGSIHETYTPDQPVKKGDEKGVFGFGASLVALLFKPKMLELAPDLLKASSEGLEILCKMGQSVGNHYENIKSCIK